MEEGADGEDTSFVVISLNHMEAGDLVDKRISLETTNGLVSTFCQRVTKIGVSEKECKKPSIFIGPIIENALYHDDIGVSNDKKWISDSLDEGWVDYLDYYED